MDKKFTIKDVSELLGISTDAIRLYEKEGLLHPTRDPQNGYRYYNAEQIHHVLGIHLYRELGIGIPEIRNLKTATSLGDVATQFSEDIQKNEEEILRLQRMNEKMHFIKQHLHTLEKGLTHITIEELPELYVLYYQDSADLEYSKLMDVLNASVFSFGNMGYQLSLPDTSNYNAASVLFVIREQMMSISPWSKDRSSLPKRPACSCLHMVCPTTDLRRPYLNLTPLLDYAREHHYETEDYAYAFYVFSLTPDDSVLDFYEIYLPLKK